MKIQFAALIALAAIAVSSPVFAQEAAPATEKLEFRKWDFSSSLGVLGASRTEFGGNSAGSCSCGNYAAWAWNVDAGRYFTPHLKAEAGLMRTTERSFFNYTPYTPTGPNISTHRSVQPTSVSGAFTYQFFENVFAHPYVSAGIRVTSLFEESQTNVYASGFSGPPSVSKSSRRSTEVRPFVAAGYKSYFNERAYIRTEALAALDKKGFSHGTVRIGFGIDF